MNLEYETRKKVYGKSDAQAKYRPSGPPIRSIVPVGSANFELWLAVSAVQKCIAVSLHSFTNRVGDHPADDIPAIIREIVAGLTSNR